MAQTFLYLGSIAKTADLESAIMAFQQAAIPHSQMVIAGDGAQKAACISLVKERGVENVAFVTCPSMEAVPALQNLADVFLLPLKKGVALSGVPSKLPAYMFSAKPVLATVDGESDTAAAIREADCGWIGQPENVKALAEKLRQVAKLPKDVLEAMGQRGREYALKHYSRAQGVELLASVVLGAARGRQAAGTVTSTRPEPAALTTA